jgi:hypothetical protein
LWRVWRLPAAERWQLALALAMLPLTALGLWAMGLRRWLALFTRLGPRDGGPASRDEATMVGEGRAAAWLVEAAARHGPYRATCLPRSLTLWWLLRRRGIASDLHIGVRKNAGRFEAHAWVELRGRVLSDDHGVRERFTAFDCPIQPVQGTLL